MNFDVLISKILSYNCIQEILWNINYNSASKDFQLIIHYGSYMQCRVMNWEK
jgi:hypothetical protein